MAILAGLMAISVAITPLWAQESRRGDRVLHRYFDPGLWGDVSPSLQQDQAAAAAEQPSAGLSPVDSGEGFGLWTSPVDGEWILTPEGPVGPGDIETPHGDLGAGEGVTGLDDDTDRVDQLDYQANFHPSVVPFKRAMVQNRIRADGGGNYHAHLEQGQLRPVSVGGSTRPGEERFEGTFLVRMEPELRHRIPSVSPHQRILSVVSEPEVELQFFRDEADNFYVSSSVRDVVRINVELAVDRHYFDGGLDAGVAWSDFEPISGIEYQFRAPTREVLDIMGISRDQMTPRQAVEHLVEYHRSFQARPFDERGAEDLYLDITQHQVGVCRHRSLVFMISALALGIPTRYVYNEAHAFVEIRWPGQGWRRIDLGGAADAFSYQGQSTGDVHDGIWDWEFPRPEIYEEEMATLAGGDSVEVDGHSARPDDGGDLAGEISEHDGDGAQPHAADEMDMGQQDSRSSPPQVQLLGADAEAFRGQSVTVRGQVESATSATMVEVVLVPLGSDDSRRGVVLGRAQTDSSGYFHAQWEVPRQVNLGRWRLVGRIVGEE